tara:strand:- start:144 stop:653 length:510 start_codon:yes stop_codon:yes gene_type:complete
MEMNKFYNDFYTKFGRTVHDIREQQEQDIVEYAENGLTEDDIVILTDMDRRRIREIIRNIKPVQEETQLNEQGYDSIVSKNETAKELFKIARGVYGRKGVVQFKGGKLTIDEKSARIMLDIIAQEEKWPQYILRDAIKNPKSYTVKEVIKLLQDAKKAQGDNRPLTQVK